jgi:hypothetical protein
MKKIEFNIWKEEHSVALSQIMKDIVDMLNKCEVPTSLFNFDFEYDEQLKMKIERLIYDKSSNSFRKR